MHRPGVELATFRSQVRRASHYTTKPPRDGVQKNLLFDLKMENFGVVFKLNLTEETKTQLQEEEAIADVIHTVK